MGAPRLTLDRDFARHVREREPLGFEHDLVGDPMLTLEAVAALGAELGPDAVSAEVASKPLISDSTEIAPKPVDVRTQILELAANDSWFTLLNIEDSPPYRALIDRIVDTLAQTTGMQPAQLRRRMGFVFASSPGSVTSAHFDIEHSLLFQLEGNRRLGFGRFRDEEHRETEVDRYWNGSFGRLDTMAEPLAELEIGPGSAAYIPPYTPHWLHNGDSPSLSLTVTFFERSNEDESMVQAFNARLARRGLRTRPFGQRPGVDRVKAAGMRTYRGVRRLARPGETERSSSH